MALRDFCRAGVVARQQKKTKARSFLRHTKRAQNNSREQNGSREVDTEMGQNGSGQSRLQGTISIAILFLSMAKLPRRVSAAYRIRKPRREGSKEKSPSMKWSTVPSFGQLEVNSHFDSATFLAFGKRQDRPGEAAQFMIAAAELKLHEIEAPVREESSRPACYQPLLHSFLHIVE